ncbi:DNA gyrase inhibitor GyrI [Alteromonadaceae bacterium Bs31]|nr:DNA gyrase inhibitor GyrI [Alteromonadaceae bacterium Bs31]
MEYKVVEREPVTVACLRHLGPYGRSIEEYWQNVFVPWLRINKLESNPRYGIARDNPMHTPAEKCRYDSCVAVDEDFYPNGSAFKALIPGGRYAVFGFKGRAEQLGMAWQRIMCDWMTEEMHINDQRPAFTYHPPGAIYSLEYDAFECELCVPIIPPLLE